MERRSPLSGWLARQRALGRTPPLHHFLQQNVALGSTNCRVPPGRLAKGGPLQTFGPHCHLERRFSSSSKKT